MSSKRNPEQRDLLGEALQVQDQISARQEVMRKSEDQPCPPDPELDILFRDFAKRMPRSKATPFLAQRTVKYPSTRGRTMEFLFGENSSLEQIEEHVTSGWPILIDEISNFAPPDGKSERGEWHGLAIDTQGRLWFARRRRNWKEPVESYSIIVNGKTTLATGYSGPELGKPKGRSLRDSIVAFCDLGGRLPGGDYSEGKQRLPQLIAQAMAVTIRG